MATLLFTKRPRLRIYRREMDTTTAIVVANLVVSVIAAVAQMWHHISKCKSGCCELEMTNNEKDVLHINKDV